MQPVPEQLTAFLLIIFLGGIIGFVFDCYRTTRTIIRPKAWGTALGDGMFWLIMTITSFGFLLFSNMGEVRFYVFLAIALGLILYFRYASSLIRPLLLKVYGLGRKVLSFLVRLIKPPLRLMMGVILLPARFAGAFFFLLMKGAEYLKLSLGGVGRRIKPPPGDKDEKIT